MEAPDHVSIPAHRAACHAVSRSRRRSARSGSLQRYVPQVHEQARETPRDLHRRMLHTDPQVHRVAEAHLLHDRTLTGRQVHKLEAAGHQVQLRATRRRPVTGQVARGAARSQPRRHHHAAKRHEQVVAEVRHDRASLLGIGDRAQRREQPGVIPAERPHAGPPDDVRQRESDRRGGGDVPRATGRHRRSGRQASSSWPGSRPGVVRARRGRPPCGAAHPPRPRRPTARAPARAGGHARAIGPAGR